MRWQETRRHIQCKYGRKYPWGPSWRCRRLHTGPKYSIISYFECNRNIHSWLLAGSEPWVILELFLVFQDLSLMILIKNSYKRKCVHYTNDWILYTRTLYQQQKTVHMYTILNQYQQKNTVHMYTAYTNNRLQYTSTILKQLNTVHYVFTGWSIMTVKKQHKS